MDWLRSEDLKEEKNVTAPIVIIATPGLRRFEVSKRRLSVPKSTSRLNVSDRARGDDVRPFQESGEGGKQS